MRVFISTDLEGIGGVCSKEQTTRGTDAHRDACRLLRAEVDAAVEGCLAAGATFVMVADGHDVGGNLSADGFPPQVRLATGAPAPYSMMHGIDESYDVALMLGYHAMAGTRGAVLDHTYTGDVFRARVDEYLEVGELGINAGLAGAYGVPVVFVSGDDKLVAEATALLPEVECAVAKVGSARTAAHLLPLDAVREAIREGVVRALCADCRPVPLSFAERSLRVTFTHTSACDAASVIPSVQRIDGRTLEIPGGDFRTVFRAFLACVDLAAGARR